MYVRTFKIHQSSITLPEHCKHWASAIRMYSYAAHFRQCRYKRITNLTWPCEKQCADLFVPPELTQTDECWLLQRQSRSHNTFKSTCCDRAKDLDQFSVYTTEMERRVMLSPQSRVYVQVQLSSSDIYLAIFNWKRSSKRKLIKWHWTLVTLSLLRLW